MVDQSAENVNVVNERLDVRVVSGSASRSSVLFQAGVPGADLCLAVTGNDEVNLIAASMAKAMGAARSVARVFGLLRLEHLRLPAPLSHRSIAQPRTPLGHGIGAQYSVSRQRNNGTLCAGRIGSR